MKVQPAALLSAVCIVFAHASGAADGSAEAGQSKAAPCVACHGVNGNSANPVWPSLAGQHSPYIV
ncbi:MAG TPA: c-type cytochrome, partial [Steroidobacter sp.]|nr:c-type cytochrome [Steroidobacter sp.]